MQNWELAATDQKLNQIVPLAKEAYHGVYSTVVQAVPGSDFTVYAYYSDGTVRLADIKPLIARGGVFAPLADESVFRSRITVLNDAVAWDLEGNRDETACIDLDPGKMYRESPVVDDPLEAVA